MRAGALVAATAAVFAALAGCGGSAAPQPRTSAPPLTTPTASPGGPAPTTPAATSQAAEPMFPATKEGAFAIVKALYAAQDSGVHDRDVSGYLALTTATCPCRVIGSYVAKLLSFHEHVDGGSITNVRPQAYATPSAGRAQVSVLYDVAADRVVTNTGQLARSDAAMSGVVEVVNLVNQSSGWRVDSLVRLTAAKP